MRSYSSGLRGPVGFLQEATNLVRVYSGDISEQVAVTIADLERMERLAAEELGIELRGLRMLDVGAGQQLIQMRYLRDRGNDVLGVDRDLVVQGFDPIAYVRMARSNGLRRAVKTLARKALRVDARLASEFARQRGLTPEKGKKLVVRQMDAESLDLPSDSFDFAYSTSVLQYLEQPAEALREMARVVKPGGGVYVDFMLFTGPTGCLDIRILGGRDALPRWAHLRPGTADVVRENAPLNRLRLHEWRELVEQAMPGSVVVLDQADPELEAEVRAAHAADELREYSLEELLTVVVSVVWRKPSQN